MASIIDIHPHIISNDETTYPPVPYPPVGLEANRKGLQLAIDWAVDQKIIPEKITVDELFDDTTATLGQ